MSTSFNTIVALNGDFIFSDKRIIITIANDPQKVKWDGVRTLENMKQSKLYLTDNKEQKEKIGKVTAFYELCSENDEVKLTDILQVAIYHIEKETSTIERGLISVGAFGLMFFAKPRRFIGITEKGYSFEINTGTKKPPIEILVFEPGVMRLYSGRENPRNLERYNEIFATKKVDEEFVKNAFLAISSRFGGSVNFDKITKDGTVTRNIKPTLEEEIEAHGIFFHPKYKTNRPVRRFWNN